MAAYLNQLKPPAGAKRRRRRVGRGNSSGQGTYAGRGSKGQKSRAGASLPAYFEGGQLPLIKRLPQKRGFTNIFRIEYEVVNVGRLRTFERGSVVDLQALQQAGLVKSRRKPVKILGDGGLDRALTVQAHKFTASAQHKIEAAGGKVEVIEVA